MSRQIEVPVFLPTWNDNTEWRLPCEIPSSSSWNIHSGYRFSKSSADSQLNKGDTLMLRIHLQLITFLEDADKENYVTDDHLDTLRGYNMHMRISISWFAPHPPITTMCVGSCSASVSLNAQNPHHACLPKKGLYSKSWVVLQRQTLSEVLRAKAAYKDWKMSLHFS